jgi:hypothetical protein
MLIEEKALKYWIDNFYGYGAWHARFWFVGYEESGGDLPEEVAEKINYFYKVHASPNPALCDIRELYRQVAVSSYEPKAGLFANRCEYRFGKNAIQNGAWKNLIAFQHGYRNEKLPDLLEYQKELRATEDPSRPQRPDQLKPTTRAIIESEVKHTSIPVPILAFFAAPSNLGDRFKDDPVARARYEAWDAARKDAIATAFEQGLPTARVIRLPRADHFVIATHEIEVLREMRAFLLRVH